MGIANIVNTSGGGGGGGSEIITNLVNSVDGAGLRLASSASIKCNDVAANRFGTADFSVEFVISQNAEAVNSDIFTSSADYTTPASPQAKSAAVIRWDVSGNGNLSLIFFNSTGTGTTYDFGVSLTADVDKPTHFVVSADRSANAVLFRNGAEVASVDISASASENIGVGGYPAVVGLPNILGFKGNIYRLRTYSKLLSSDEAKNVFDRADVPTALVSNLLLDLDCAYANPTQSTVIQDRGPNNQDGTLNGTITQTNVIKQLNSVSARIGTTAATPVDGQIIGQHIVAGDSTENHAWLATKSTAGYYSGIKLTRGAGTFADDANNNFGFIVSDIGLSAAKFTSPGADVTGRSNLLNIDSSGRVGVGVSPGAKLHVSSGTTNNLSDDLSEVRFIGPDKAITGEQANVVIQTNDDFAINKGGSIALGGRHTTSSTNGANFAQISGRKENATTANFAGYLAFSTSDAASDIHERMRISSTGNVQIGTGSLAAIGSGPTLGLVGAAPEITLRDSATGTPYAVMRTNDNGNLILEADSGDDAASSQIEFKVDGATATTISSTGLATFSNGIAFSQTNTSATGATADASTLSHYEVGRFTPKYEPSSGSDFNAITYGFQDGHYVRVGNICHCTVHMRTTNVDTTGMTTSASLMLGGLPFPAATVTGTGYAFGVTSISQGFASNNPSNIKISEAASVAMIQHSKLNQNVTVANMTAGAATGNFIGVQFIYQV